MAVESDSLAPLIVLAGGRSSRMRIAKGLVQYRGKPWIEEQLARFAAGGGTQAVIVLGYRADEYLAALPWLREAQTAVIRHAGLTIRTVLNDKPEAGPFSSVLCGARGFGMGENHATGEGGIFVLPVDVPGAAPEVWRALESTMLRRSGLNACIPRCGEKGGHPVLLSRSFVGALMKVPLDSEAARLDLQLRRLPARQLAQVQVSDPSVGINLNTPADWEKLL
jgi:CTP:molybdopterin cytidylyltransferase MocA